ncbi:MAG: hypothetical protein LBI78_04885 [Campylobacteraceae bacterium]|nr:hypothetical protein [Campylobacteraceae bacterium]
MNGKTEINSVIARSFGLYERRWGMASICELCEMSAKFVGNIIKVNY